MLRFTEIEFPANEFCKNIRDIILYDIRDLGKGQKKS